jgi:hypothetical protein
MIERAHHSAVRDALIFIEKHALFTREGPKGVRQGLVAAAFKHRDSRSGDPDLHTQTHSTQARAIKTVGQRSLRKRPPTGTRLRGTFVTPESGSAPGHKCSHAERHKCAAQLAPLPLSHLGPARLFSRRPLSGRKW